MTRTRLTLTCPFCSQKTRRHGTDERSLALLTGVYLAHLVESHWEVLELAREQRLASGVPINDAWTRP